MANAQDNPVNEQQLEQAAQDVAEAQGRDAQDAEQPDEKLGDAGKRALEAEREARKKAVRENQELRARIEKFEDAQRTDEERRAHELEKLRGKAQAAEQRANELQRQLLVSQVAREAGLPVEMEERLRGDSEAELRADAEKLKELIGARTRGFPRVPEAGAAHDTPASTSALFASAFGRAFDNA